MSEAPPLFMRVLPDGVLRPQTRFDLEHISTRYAVGTQLRAKLTQPRSVPRHRLYWSVLAEVVDATGDRWCSVEDLHESIKLHLRMVRGISMLGGGVRYVTASIAFEKMDEGQFKNFFEKAMLAICEETGIDTQALIQAAIEKGTGRESAA